jgi:hypothetical protein
VDAGAERLAGWRGCHGCEVNGVVVKRSLKVAGLETGVAVEMGGEAGLIQSLSQCLLPMLRAWAEVGGIAPSLCFKAAPPQPVSI